MLTSDTFVGNEAPRTLGEGGAVHVGAGLELIVHNSTFAGNEGRFGGAIWADIGSQVSLVHTTMSGPTASVGDALFSLGTVDFQSSLIDGECAGTGSRTSLGSNLESPGDTCGFSAETDRPNVANAALGSLADHGGPESDPGAASRLPGQGLRRLRPAHRSARSGPSVRRRWRSALRRRRRRSRFATTGLDLRGRF